MPDVGEVIERVRRHFVPTEDAYVAGRPAFSVAVEDGGRIEVTARGMTSGPSRSAALSGRPLELETISVDRGGRALLDQRATISVAADGHMRISRGGVDEEVLNLPEGVEQRWVFDRKPFGDGDLEVVVATEGLAYVGEDERGHHFIDEASGLGLCYGPASWIDGAQRRSPVQVTFDDGALRLVVAQFLLEKSAFPAVLDPVISPELGLLSSSATFVSALEQTDPSISVPQGGYMLVVWSDLRTGVDFDIYGALVNTDLSLPVPAGFSIAEGPGDQLSPDVGDAGFSFNVAWIDRAEDGATYGVQGALVGSALSSPRGPFVGPVVEYQRLASPMSDLSVSDDGSLVLWTLDVGGNPMVQLGVNGQAGSGSALPTTLPSGTPTRAPQASCSGSGCYVVFEAGGYPGVEVRGVAVETDGSSNGIDQLLAGGGTPQREPTISHLSNTDRYLVAWRDGADGTGDIRGLRIDAATNNVLDTAGFLINDAPGLAQNPTVACLPTECLVVWEDDRYGDPLPAPGTRNELDLLGTVVLDDGTVVHPNSFGVNLVAGDQVHASAAAYAAVNAYFVAWDDLRDGVGDIFGTRIDVAPYVVADGHGTALSRSRPNNQDAAVVYRHPHYLVVFADSRKRGDRDYDIKGVRMHRWGFVTDPAGVPLVTAPGQQTAPDVAYDAASDRFLLTWLDDRTGSTEHHIRLFGASLSPVGPDMSIGPGVHRPRVATASGSFLVARDVPMTAPIGPDRSDVVMEVVDPNGIVSPIGTIDLDDFDQVEKVVSSGSQWMVFSRSSDDSPPVTYWATPAFPGFGAGMWNSMFTTSSPVRMDATFDGTYFVATFSETNRIQMPEAVYAMRVDSSATNVGAITLPLGPSDRDVAVGTVQDRTLNAPTWFVAFVRYGVGNVQCSTNPSTGCVSPYWWDGTLMGARFETDGTPIGSPFVIAHEGFVIGSAEVRGGRPEQAIVTYERMDEGPTTQSRQIYGRVVDFP